MIAVEQRSHGQSDRSDPPYSWTLFGDDLVALIKILNLENITAVGHSMGGHVVLQAAAALPNRFKRLLVLDPVIFADDWPEPSDEHYEQHPTALRRNHWNSVEEMYDRFKTRVPFSEWDTSVLWDYCNHGLLERKGTSGLELACPPICESAIYVCKGNKAIYSQLKSITVPVKILRAKERTADDSPFDFRPSATWPKLVEQIQNASEQYLPNHSHFIPMEDPELVAREIVQISG